MTLLQPDVLKFHQSLLALLCAHHLVQKHDLNIQAIYPTWSMIRNVTFCFSATSGICDVLTRDLEQSSILGSIIWCQSLTAFAVPHSNFDSPRFVEPKSILVMMRKVHAHLKSMRFGYVLYMMVHVELFWIKKGITKRIKASTHYIAHGHSVSTTDKQRLCKQRSCILVYSKTKKPLQYNTRWTLWRYNYHH